MVALPARRAAKSKPESTHPSRRRRCVGMARHVTGGGYFKSVDASLTTKLANSANPPNPAFVFIREIRGQKPALTKAMPGRMGEFDDIVQTLVARWCELPGKLLPFYPDDEDECENSIIYR